MGNHAQVPLPVSENLSQYLTSHPGQLSLAIPPWIGAMSTSQTAVMPCSWGVRAGMVCEWVAGKTVIPLLSRAISEHFSSGFIPQQGTKHVCGYFTITTTYLLKKVILATNSLFCKWTNTKFEYRQNQTMHCGMQMFSYHT